MEEGSPTPALRRTRHRAVQNVHSSEEEGGEPRACTPSQSKSPAAVYFASIYDQFLKDLIGNLKLGVLLKIFLSSATLLVMKN